MLKVSTFLKICQLLEPQQLRDIILYFLMPVAFVVFIPCIFSILQIAMADKVEASEKVSKAGEKKPVTETEKKVKSVSESEKKAKPQVKNNNSKSGVKNGKHEKLDDAAVEKEFLSFIAKMRSKYPGNGLAYQMNNYPEVGPVVRVISWEWSVRFMNI